MAAERVFTRRLSVLLGAGLFNWTAGNGLFPLRAGPVALHQSEISAGW